MVRAVRDRAERAARLRESLILRRERGHARATSYAEENVRRSCTVTCANRNDVVLYERNNMERLHGPAIWQLDLSGSRGEFYRERRNDHRRVINDTFTRRFLTARVNVPRLTCCGFCGWIKSTRPLWPLLVFSVFLFLFSSARFVPIFGSAPRWKKLDEIKQRDDNNCRMISF